MGKSALSAGKKVEVTNKKDVMTIFATASFALSFIVIGLPLWWKTTNVYRVTLPYSEIEELSSFLILHMIPVNVVLASNSVHQSQLWEELIFFSNNSYSFKENPHLKIRFSWKMRTAFEEEEMILEHSRTLYDLDNTLSSVSRTSGMGSINVLVIDESKFKDHIPFIGCHHWSYIFTSDDAVRIATDIISVVKDATQTALLEKVFNAQPLHDRKMPDKDRKRSLSATSAFDITFSLIIPEPHFLDVHWDIENAVDVYVTPFIERLSLVYDVDIKSQILYMTLLPIKTSYKIANGSYTLSFDQLPLLINPIEAKLGSYASVNPTLNFVIYVPPQEQTPLQILNKDDTIIENNAFLSPQWGGFLIQNFPVAMENATIPVKVAVNMQNSMEIFLSQLRLLLGLPDIPTVKSSVVEFSHSPMLCDWEVDFVVRKSAHEQISVAVSSLYSLSQLLQMISNIVINDDIGEKVYFAIASIKESISALSQGLLEMGCSKAKDAFISSEQAFFDPSLLALLYFPDDQKYAIYIPLFLPVGIPVILSLRQLWKYWKEGTSNKEKVD